MNADAIESALSNNDGVLKLSQAPGHDSPTASPFWSAADTTSTTCPSIESGMLPTEALTPDTPFTNAADIFDRLASVNGDAFTVAYVTPGDMRDLERERDTRARRVRFHYISENKRLIITIPKGPHEMAYGELERQFLKTVDGMGLESSWKRVFTTTFPYNQTATGSSGEADAGGGPEPDRRFACDWPTLVIEAGYSQTLNDLRQKRDFWFTESQHDVKIVLLVKLYRNNPYKRILIEQWQEMPATVPRPGATLTRQASITSRLDPVCVQMVNIVWGIGTPSYDDVDFDMRTDPSSFNVTRGPLILDFAQCFLRQPVGPHEHNIVFIDQALQLFAARVWKME